MKYLNWPRNGEEDEALEVKLDKLRDAFKLIRDAAPEKREGGEETAVHSSGGLEEGILGNVFLVFDGASMDSMDDAFRRDDMWVCAVDPDYKGGSLPTPSGQEDTREGDEEVYKGYLRVRVQQLVNNFFNMRYFHSEEYTLADLWAVAANSHNRAFVSVDEMRQHYTVVTGGQAEPRYILVDIHGHVEDKGGEKQFIKSKGANIIRSVI
jgi:hypothetical protein